MTRWLKFIRTFINTCDYGVNTYIDYTWFSESQCCIEAKIKRTWLEITLTQVCISTANSCGYYYQYTLHLIAGSTLALTTFWKARTEIRFTFYLAPGRVKMQVQQSQNFLTLQMWCRFLCLKKKKKKAPEKEGLQVIKAEQVEPWFTLTGVALEEWSLRVTSIIVKVLWSKPKSETFSRP